MNGLAPKRMDWSLTGTILALLTISILFIYSAHFRPLDLWAPRGKDSFLWWSGLRALSLNRLV